MKIEEDYTKKIANALEARGDHAENPSMEHLTEKYYSCITF
jgi:hypothetical protein